MKILFILWFQGVYRGRNIDFTADKAGGRQYTSFEGGRKEIEPRSPPKPLTPPPVGPQFFLFMGYGS